jgi:hypothetical protein
MDTELQPAQPIDELSALVTWGAALFYWAEHDYNDNVDDYWDALNYIATSLSVGYANIFPVTPLGKTIGAVVQMVGPALSARALDGADAPAEPLGPKLDAILAELQKLNAR